MPGLDEVVSVVAVAVVQRDAVLVAVCADVGAVGEAAQVGAARGGRGAGDLAADGVRPNLGADVLHAVQGLVAGLLVVAEVAVAAAARRGLFAAPADPADHPQQRDEQRRREGAGSVGHGGEFLGR